jgi:hypothetical protein
MAQDTKAEVDTSQLVQSVRQMALRRITRRKYILNCNNVRGETDNIRHSYTRSKTRIRTIVIISLKISDSAYQHSLIFRPIFDIFHSPCSHILIAMFRKLFVFPSSGDIMKWGVILPWWPYGEPVSYPGRAEFLIISLHLKNTKLLPEQLYLKQEFPWRNNHLLRPYTTRTA